MFETYKVCIVCDNEKPIDEFCINKYGKHGRHSCCRECIRKRSKNRYKVDPLYTRKNYLKRYGMTIDDYDRALEAQSFRCKICGSSKPDCRGRFAVDHNHATGEVRGLLCNSCNAVLGHARENISILLSAIEYLKEYSDINVIESQARA